jgi:hypothetical protein
MWPPPASEIPSNPDCDGNEEAKHLTAYHDVISSMLAEISVVWHLLAPEGKQKQQAGALLAHYL